MEKALLVAVKMEHERDGWSLRHLSQEIEELTQSTGVESLETITCNLERPTPNLFIGKGKAQEIGVWAQDIDANVVIFSADLSGTQQRNLEEVLGRKTIDRTQLILDIFARHAHSPEGKTQVELAQLKYLLPRLAGKGIVLSRLGGGIGTRGPGEQKLEVDRRRIRKRIEKLQDDLQHLRLHRETLRKRRKENNVASAALVGYTNAGKSTLLNALTGAGQIVRDAMFTTLDPLAKGVKLANGETVIFSDTVGFLHKLPHHLIEAFKATLEEVLQTDLLIHVLDISHPMAELRYASVLEVLKEIGAESKPIITVLNKIDAVADPSWLPKIQEEFAGSITISAKTGENLAAVLSAVQKRIEGRMRLFEAKINHGRMDLVNMLYKEGKVMDIAYQQRKVKVRANLPAALYEKLIRDPDIELLS